MQLQGGRGQNIAVTGLRSQKSQTSGVAIQLWSKICGCGAVAVKDLWLWDSCGQRSVVVGQLRSKICGCGAVGVKCLLCGLFSVQDIFFM